MSHTHRSDSQEESDGSMHTDCCTTHITKAPKVTAQTEMYCAG